MLGGWFSKGSSLTEYEVGAECAEQPGGADGENALACWKLHAGTRRADGAGVSVLRLVRAKSEGDKSTKVTSAARCLRATKKLRMPHILRYVDGACHEESGGEIVVVTDECLPLEAWLATARGQDPRNLAWGAYCLLKALEFLHGAGLAHGNLTPRSVFVTNAGDWKLWGFELATHLVPGDDDESLAFFRANEALVDLEYRSPERVQRDWEQLAVGKVGAMDMWALSEVLRVAFSRIEGGLPRELAVWTRRCADGVPSKRPTAEQVLRGCPLFRQPFLHELVALQELAASTVEEQVAFYRKLDAKTSRALSGDAGPTTGALGETLWRGACVHKLLPQLLATLGIALAAPCGAEGADEQRRAVVKCALPLLVQIVAMLGTDVTREASSDDPAAAPLEGAELLRFAAERRICAQIVVALEQILVIRDVGIRLEALRRVDALAPLLRADFVNRKLFDALLLGFGDTNDDARLMTLMAMLAIAPALNEKNRTDRLLRVVKRLECDATTKIRTNVVIFYGRLAPKLSDALRQRVVLPAFLKALDDKVPYVRLAALRALGACRGYFSPQLGARAIAPKLAPLLLDPAQHVRDAAAPCLDSYLSAARQEAQKMNADEDAQRKKQHDEHLKQQSSSPAKKSPAEATKAAAKPGASTSSASAPQDATAAVSAADTASSWGSWALQKVASKTSELASKVAAPTKAAPAAAAPAAPVAAAVKPEPVKQPETAAAASSSSGDGWGASDGWGDDDDDLSTTAKPPKAPSPASKQKQPPKAASGWGDEDTWGEDEGASAPVVVVQRAPAAPTPARAGASAGASADERRRAKKAEFDARKLARASAPPAAAAAAPAPARPPAQPTKPASLSLSKSKPPAPAAEKAQPPAQTAAQPPKPPKPKAASLSLSKPKPPAAAAKPAKSGAVQTVKKLALDDKDNMWDDF